MNRERIVELIKHYQVVPELKGWGWPDCVWGVALKKGWLTEQSVGALTAALDISYSDAHRLIYMTDAADFDGDIFPIRRYPTVEERKQFVVATLQRFLATSRVEWAMEDAPQA